MASTMHARLSFIWVSDIMSQEVLARWKIRVKVGDKEIEVIAGDLHTAKKWFDELEKKYLK